MKNAPFDRGLLNHPSPELETLKGHFKVILLINRKSEHLQK